MDATNATIQGEYRGRGWRLCMLVRREVWEHRSLWILPAILTGLVVLFTLLSLIAPARINANLDQADRRVVVHSEGGDLSRLLPGLAESGFHMELGEVTVENLLHFFDQLPHGVRAQFLKLALLGGAKTLLLPLGLLVLILTLNVLRQESRNRSIYFFKSMPLSELEMIGAKALLMLPGLLLLMMATLMASQLLALLILSVAALVHGLNPLTLFWGPAHLFSNWWLILRLLAVDFLWFMPTMAALFALNAWHDSRRLLAAVGVFAVAILDRLYLSGGEMLGWLGRHGTPPGWAVRGPAGDAFTEFQGVAHVAPVDWLDLGGGVLLALVLFWAATVLLRWREER